MYVRCALITIIIILYIHVHKFMIDTVYYEKWDAIVKLVDVD